MFKFIKKSFKAKVVFIITISIFLSGIAISAIILKSQYESQLDQMKIDGLNIAKITAKNIEDASIGSNKENVQNIVEKLANSNGIQYVDLIDINMVDVIDSQKEDIGKSFADDLETIETVRDKKDTASFYIDPTGSKVLDLQVPVDFKVGDSQIASIDVGLSMDSLYKSIYKSIIISFILTLGFIIVFSIIPIIVINRIAVEPLKEGLKLAESIADKDLRLCIESNSKDEIGAIINSIEQAKNNLKDIICEVQLSAEEVTSASEVLNLSLSSINNNTQDMTIFVDNISKNMQENIYIIEETNTEIEGIVSNSNKINNFILELEKETVKIRSVINTISETSGKTNLLGVNESIEPDREEKADNELTVVADEVKNLAIQSGQSLECIIELTKNIQDTIQKTVEVATIGVTQSDIVENNINQVIKNVDNIESYISMISKMTIMQSTSIKNVQGFIEKIILTTKVNSEKAQEMNECIEEQMSADEEINAISNELENMSVKLTKLVNEFKVF